MSIPLTNDQFNEIADLIHNHAQLINKTLSPYAKTPLIAELMGMLEVLTLIHVEVELTFKDQYSQIVKTQVKCSEINTIITKEYGGA